VPILHEFFEDEVVGPKFELKILFRILGMRRLHLVWNPIQKGFRKKRRLTTHMQIPGIIGEDEDTKAILIMLISGATAQ